MRSPLRKLPALLAAGTLVAASVLAAPPASALTAPDAGTAAPKVRTDVVVQSFDGTPIHTNFFPALGLQAGVTAMIDIMMIALGIGVGSLVFRTFVTRPWAVKG